MFLQLDGTFWIQLVSFVVFYGLLNVVFLRPVGNAIRKRREYINSVTADYDRYQAEANVLRMQAEDLRAQARRAAEQTVANGRAQTSNAAAAVAMEYAHRVSQTVEDAARKVQAESLLARADEAQVVRQLADLMLDKTLSGASK